MARETGVGIGENKCLGKMVLENAVRKRHKKGREKTSCASTRKKRRRKEERKSGEKKEKR